MAAKGSLLKEDITKKILEYFPGSFKYDKEIRIPGLENSEEIQIKVTLTCAKTNVNNDNTNDNGSNIVNEVASGFNDNAINKPTEEEKKSVADLIAKLGFTQ